MIASNQLEFMYRDEVREVLLRRHKHQVRILNVQVFGPRWRMPRNFKTDFVFVIFWNNSQPALRLDSHIPESWGIPGENGVCFVP